MQSATTAANSASLMCRSERTIGISGRSDVRNSSMTISLPSGTKSGAPAWLGREKPLPGSTTMVGPRARFSRSIISRAAATISSGVGAKQVIWALWTVGLRDGQTLGDSFESVGRQQPASERPRTFSVRDSRRTWLRPLAADNPGLGHSTSRRNGRGRSSRETTGPPIPGAARTRRLPDGRHSWLNVRSCERLARTASGLVAARHCAGARSRTAMRITG